MKAARIALIQICPEPGQIDKNAEKILSFLKEAAARRADLAVFPECSLTGYRMESADQIAIRSESESGTDLARIRHECDRLKISACFGYIEQSREGLYITQELYGCSNRILYRKTHLGSIEKDVFRAGDAFPVTEGPVRCGIQLCWESHIPEISSIERRRGAELLLVPYASPMTGERCLENWSVHLPARASDNGAYLAACNLLFHDKQNDSLRGGGLAVFDPKGRRIAGFFGTDEHMILCSLAGPLPRELEQNDMHNISYFDRKRDELFSSELC